MLSSEVSKKSDRPMLAPLAWAKARKPRWWVVRESYLVAVDEPDQVKPVLLEHPSIDLSHALRLAAV